jgi:hypothetical protein
MAQTSIAVIADHNADLMVVQMSTADVAEVAGSAARML